MQSQAQQQAVTADSSQAAHAQSGQFAQDVRAHFGTGYQQNGHGNQPDGGHAGSAPLGVGLNLQNQRSGSKYNLPKGNMPVTMPPYPGQLVLFPNGPMLNGIHPVPPFAPTSVLGHNQVGQIPYMPTMYPNVSTAFPMAPAAIQGYPVPFLADSNMPHLASQKRNAWAANEEHKATGQLASDNHDNQNDYYSGPAVSNIEGSSFNYGGLQQPCLPYQMMKTSNGYMLQDLESLTQQDPPIPRAVPAMWTNPSELTLAKCLENREGITNVYIRGFLPETTDEMLHAYAARFGKIDRCKAIVDLDTGLCKGYVPAAEHSSNPPANPSDRFGFVQYFNFESCENCIRGFFYLGYQASFAQVQMLPKLLEDCSLN